MSIIKPLNTKLSARNRQGHACKRDGYKPYGSNRHRFYQKNRGFTLLEALIGFLVLSIGMLGIASLQAVSLKAGKSAVYGSVAMMKVGELFESMRVNSTALAVYANAGNGADNGCTDGFNCTAAQLAEDDVFWWNQNLTAGLPVRASTTTNVVLLPLIAGGSLSSMRTVTITVSWLERDQNVGGGESVARNYTASASICTAVPC